MSRTIALALFVLAIVTGSTAFARANELDGALAPDGRLAVAQQQADAQRNAVAMRNTGVVMTVLAPVSIGVGMFELMRGVLCDSCSYGSSLANIGVGIGLIAAGGVGGAAGIPLWAVGQYRANKAERATLQLSGGGVKLTF